MLMQYIPCIIFSVDRPEHSAGEKISNRSWCEQVMRESGIGHEKLIGCYQGVTEMSFLVPIAALDHGRIAMIKGIAKEHDQDSILYRDTENQCVLMYFDGREPLKIGALESVSQQEALNNEAYTFSPRLGQYFVCK